MKMISSTMMLTACAMFAWGCDATAKKTPAPAKSDAPKKPSSPTAKTKDDAPKKAPQDPKADSDIPMEVDPAATTTVKLVDLKGTPPENFKVKGALVHLMGWTDKGGMNVFAISRYQTASKSGVSQMMLGRIANRGGDASWTDTRVFKEQVSSCQFDITLEPQVGDWVIKDVDGDGFAEVTFAYHAGCRSDVSPVTHKVLVASGQKKYALRGNTSVAADGKTYDAGGDFKADPSFAKAPKGLQAHAEKVWKQTVREKM